MRRQPARPHLTNVKSTSGIEPTSSAHSPRAALTGRRPPTAAVISRMTPASARPSEPRDGSLTSMTAAPPSRAARASCAERTLTSSCIVAVPDRLALFMKCPSWLLRNPNLGFNLEEAEPARIFLERQDLRRGEFEAVQKRQLEPVGFVSVGGLVG